jgi:hypothetical protein
MSILTCPCCHSRSLETYRVGSWRQLSVCACGLAFDGDDQHSLHIVLDGRRRAPQERGVRQGIVGGLNRQEAERSHVIQSASHIDR